MFGNYNNYPFPPVRQTNMAMSYLKGRAVSSLDEVKGAMIDMDGQVNVFPDFGHDCVYTKQIGMDGTPIIRKYTIDNTVENGAGVPVDQLSLQQAIKPLNEKIEALEAKIGGIGYEYDTDDGADAAEPNVSAGNANGAGQSPRRIGTDG